jgi:hypothetical protein
MGGNVARMGEMKNAYKILIRKSEGRDHAEDLGVVGRLIFDWISGIEGGKMWTGFIGLRIGISGGLLLTQ